jgi:hypothetical protein
LAGLSETPHDDGALSAPNDRLAVAPSTQDFVHKAVRGEDGQGPSEDFKRIEALVDGGKAKATLPTALDSQHQKKVAISDMFEIQSSQLAVAKQADADTNAGRVEGHTLGRRAFGTTAAPPVDTAGSKHGAA